MREKWQKFNWITVVKAFLYYCVYQRYHRFAEESYVSWCTAHPDPNPDPNPVEVEESEVAVDRINQIVRKSSILQLLSSNAK